MSSLKEIAKELAQDMAAAESVDTPMDLNVLFKVRSRPKQAGQKGGEAEGGDNSASLSVLCQTAGAELVYSLGVSIDQAVSAPQLSADPVGQARVRAAFDTLTHDIKETLEQLSFAATDELRKRIKNSQRQMETRLDASRKSNQRQSHLQQAGAQNELGRHLQEQESKLREEYEEQQLETEKKLKTTATQLETMTARAMQSAVMVRRGENKLEQLQNKLERDVEQTRQDEQSRVAKQIALLQFTLAREQTAGTELRERVAALQDDAAQGRAASAGGKGSPPR